MNKENEQNLFNPIKMNGLELRNRIVMAPMTRSRALSNIPTELLPFGSTFISNPDLPFKLKNNLQLTKADPSTFYTADEKGYTDYPSTETNV